MRTLVALCLVALCVTLGLAGCVSDEKAGGAAKNQRSDGSYIEGILVDEELFPVEGVTVVNNVNDVRTLSDAEGQFALGPLEPGDYGLTFEKKGYATTSTAVVVTGDILAPIKVILTAVAQDVPYHLSEPHTTFVICASRNPIGGTPCTKAVDYAAGTSLSPEETFAFPFKIPYDNLTDMVVEMTWTPQQFGKDMLFYIQTPPNQLLTAATVKYFAMDGSSPLIGWVSAGKVNTRASQNAAFDATPNKVAYEGSTVWSGENATIPGVPGYASGTSLYLNHRTEVWMTMFYNRAGSREFTALPDN